MSYYEQKIAALEARIEEMANLERMKAVKVEAQLMVRIGELNDENARLKAEVERLIKAGDDLVLNIQWRNVVFSDFSVVGKELIQDCQCSAHNFDKVIAAWNAAKEGKQP